MRTDTFRFADTEGRDIFVYKWASDQENSEWRSRPKGVVQIAHGMAETAARYERLARVLAEAGYIVYANDHRGHGNTARSADELMVIGENGFERMTEAMSLLTDRIAAEHPGLPVFLFGHSMGSFLAQQYMYRCGSKLRGVILSGTSGRQGPLLGFGIRIAESLCARKGAEHRSELLMGLSLGGYNRVFRPNRTAFDWLSRDEAEVDKYVQDPLCGALPTAGFFRDMFHCLQDIHRWSHMERIPKELPVYIFAGDRDPVGRQGKGIKQLVDMYRKLGLRDVAWTLYPGGRHEMLNEINRDEVMRHVVEWLDRKLPPSREETSE